MIYQLPNGRIIHLSLEQYLDMSDQDLQDLNCLGNEFTSEAIDPFFKSALTGSSRERKIEREKELKEEHEYEPNLTEITDIDKLADDYFHPDDV
jgi:hypothetical protein